MLKTQQGKNLVHEFTMEYIRQNNLLCCDKKSIPEKIDEIIEVQNIISDAIEKRYFDFNFL